MAFSYSQFIKELSAEVSPGQRILVAVSGGVDSVVLLHLLKRAAGEAAFEIEAAHLDHQLRPESVQDADFVGRLCDAWSIPLHCQSVDVEKLAKQQKIGVEEAGRNARRGFLSALADARGARFVALAHHRDDQVETFMMRLIRGSGLSGLACMRRRQDLWWRPLLDYSREQLLEYARANHLSWREDESNRDIAFTRNRIRHQVLPAMAEINRRYAERIAATVNQLQAESSYWQALVEEMLPGIVVDGIDGLRMDRGALMAAHPALRFHLYREGLRRVRGDLQKIEAQHLRAIDNLLTATNPQAHINLPAAWVARRYAVLWFRTAPPEASAPFSAQLAIPGELPLPEGRVLRAVLQDEQEGESENVVEFPYDQLTGPLVVRSWRPGDRFRPLGMSGHKKLKHFFCDQHLEFEERSKVLVLVHDETILWVIGRRRSGEAASDSKTAQILRLELI